MEIGELELISCNGNETLAEIWAGFCVLSDAQELAHTGMTSADKQVIEHIDHAKKHIMSGMIRMGFGKAIRPKGMSPKFDPGINLNKIIGA